jgi:hypothetical protein
MYIHYGSNAYAPEKFKEIQNLPLQAKPQGGLWGSPVSARHGWVDWCRVQEFQLDKLGNSFMFTLDKNAKILRLESVNQLHGLPEQAPPVGMPEMPSAWVCLDFEKLKADGYDAIEVDISGEYRRADVMDNLYFALYGWDCDSILVMNKEIIVF